MQAQAIELIDKCIEVLERDGWRRNSYGYGSNNTHCLVGALHVAAYGYNTFPGRDVCNLDLDALYAYTYARISEHLVAHNQNLRALIAGIRNEDMYPEAWNDTVATSKEEVIEMLNHCKFHMLRAAEMAARPWPEVAQTATA